MTQGTPTPRCGDCRKRHLKCERNPLSQPQCDNCKKRGVASCIDVLPPPVLRRTTQASRPTRQNCRPPQRHSARLRSSSHESNPHHVTQSVGEPGAADADGSSDSGVDNDHPGVAFEPQKTLETCREWLIYHEYLRVIGRSPGKLEPTPTCEQSAATKARRQVSDQLLNPIHAALRCEIGSSKVAWQHERFLLQLQLLVRQFQREIPTNESRSLLELEDAAFKQRTQILDALSGEASMSTLGLQLTREALAREEVEWTKRREKCQESQLDDWNVSSMQSNYSTPISVPLQTTVSDPTSSNAALLAKIQDSVAEASKLILARPCPIDGPTPLCYIPLLFRAFLLGSEDDARQHLANARNIKSLRDWSGKTLAHVAAQSGRIHLVGQDRLGKYRSVFDQPDKFQLNPVMIAAIHAPLESLKLLIAAGYSINQRDLEGRNLISIAARHGRRDVVEYLIGTRPASVNDDNGIQSSSPIYEAVEFAIENDNPSTCFLLLGCGADSSVDVYRKTAPGKTAPGKTALGLANEKDPHYLGHFLVLFQYQTQPNGNVDEYSIGFSSQATTQPPAAGGPNYYSHAAGPSFSTQHQAPNLANQYQYTVPPSQDSITPQQPQTFPPNQQHQQLSSLFQGMSQFEKSY